MAEAYRIPAGAVTATVTEKKSVFIALLAPAATEAEALAHLAAAQAAHRAANHHVYAYRLREGARTRHSDDGEPAQTAGLPVLSALTHAGLVNCIVVVTRYFGGTLLGKGGLVRAYTAAANAAIASAQILKVQTLRRLHLQMGYAQYETARRLLNEGGAKLESEPVFEADVRLCAVLPGEDAARMADKLTDALHGNIVIAVSDAYEGVFEQ